MEARERLVPRWSGKLWTSFAWLGLWALCIPVAVHACPVCFAAEQRQLWAYFGTAVLLSLLPFTMSLAIWLWIRSEARRAQSVRRTGLEPAGHEAGERVGLGAA